MRFNFAGERVIHRGNGQLAQNGRVLLDFPQNVDIAADQIAFGSDSGTETVSCQQFERVARELLGALERIVRITHCAGGDHARACFAAQVVADDAQRVLLGADCVKIIVAVAFRPAVAINAAMAAAAVDVHIIACAEPVCGAFGIGDNGFGGKHLHSGSSFPAVWN